MDIKVYTGCGRSDRAFVLGHEFGPCLLALSCGEGEALDVYDEEFGHRVDFNDSDLNDFPGDTLADRVESAMNDGEIRVNDGGTYVWVSHYEWMKEFAGVEQAKEFIRASAGINPVEYIEI